MSDCVLSFTEMLLPVVLGLPKCIDPALGEAELRRQCRRVARVSRLLLHILSLSCLCSFSGRPGWFQGLNPSTPVCCGLHEVFGVPGGQRPALPLTGWIAALLLS